jgi:hypothetical protein
MPTAAPFRFTPLRPVRPVWAVWAVWAAVLGLGAVLASSAWADAMPPGKSSALDATEARQRTALMAAIGTPQCSADRDCGVIGIGARACGGAESHAAYSTRNTDAAQLKQLAEAHASTRRQQHSSNQRMGICTVLPEPAARCNTSAQRCELVPANGATVR